MPDLNSNAFNVDDTYAIKYALTGLLSTICTSDCNKIKNTTKMKYERFNYYLLLTKIYLNFLVFHLHSTHLHSFK